MTSDQTTSFHAWKLPEPTGPTERTVALIAGVSAIKQSLRMLLSTVPGERLMRPDYGCPLNTLLFLPNDETTAGLAIYYVRQAVERWERRVEIVRLDAAAHPNSPDALTIEMDYRVRTTGEQGNLQMTVNLAGGQAS